MSVVFFFYLERRVRGVFSLQTVQFFLHLTGPLASEHARTSASVLESPVADGLVSARRLKDFLARR